MLQNAPPVRFPRQITWLIAGIAVCCGSAVAQGANEFDLAPQLRLNLGPHGAPVRALSFSGDGQILYSAGEDKVVRGWKMPAPAAALVPEELRRTPWKPIRSLRWDVEPGLRGTIYALAANPAADEVVMAGVSYSGQVGDLFWASGANGKFFRTTVGLPNDQQEHRYTVSGIAYSADGQSAASIDLTGRALLWRWPEGKPALIPLQDATGAATGELRGIAFLGNRYVTAARYAGLKSFGQNVQIGLWDIVRYDTHANPPAPVRLQDAVQTPAPHYGRVTAMAASANGQYLATADAGRQLWLWRFGPDGQVQVEKLSEGKLIQSLAFDALGTRLLAGGAAEAGRRAEVQLWNLQQPGTPPLVEPAAGTVQACALSPDGGAWAFAVEGEASVELRWSGKEGAAVVRSTIPGGEQVVDASFCFGSGADGKPVSAYLTRFETAQGKVHYFDPAKLQALRQQDFPKATPFPTETWPTPLRVGVTHHAGVDRLIVRQNDAGQSPPIDLLHAVQGQYSCHCAVLEPRSKRRYIAIGTRTTNAVYVYDLQRPQQPAQVFRGHESTITRVGVSWDQRYLVSGSIDGTVRYWPLALDKSPAYTRWGCDFQVVEGGLQVTGLSDLSVLYKKGVRDGDLLRELQWQIPAEAAPRGAQQPAAMRDELARQPHHIPFTFHFERAGQGLPEPIQDVAAWEPILSLFLTESDFIIWTPTGYYECSAAGERLLGWHVNNRLTEEPSFFVAEQFAGKYNRPDIIRGLLPAGSLQRALAFDAKDPPAIGQAPVVRPDPIVPQIVEEVIPLEEALPPSVAIVKIGATDVTDLTETVTVKEAAVTILATAESRSASHPIESMEVLLNGSPPELQARGVQAQFRQQQKAFTIQLTPGKHRVAIRAHIAVDDGKTKRIHGISREILVEYLPEKAVNRLFVLAIGVSQYAHADLKPADFADDDAKAISQVMSSHLTQSLFPIRQQKLLLNEQATKENVAKELQWMDQNMQLGDVGIVFFAGHGMQHQEKLFLLPTDGDPNRLAETAITEDDWKEFFRRMGGRGNFIFMVDACHAGAFNLNDIGKDLARTDYGVIFLGSASATQQAIGAAALRNGVFTKTALDALNGEAESIKDGFVKSNELAFYVVNSVPLILEKMKLGHLQHPVVGNINFQSNDNSFPIFSITEVQSQLAAQIRRP